MTVHRLNLRLSKIGLGLLVSFFILLLHQQMEEPSLSPPEGFFEKIVWGLRVIADNTTLLDLITAGIIGAAMIALVRYGLPILGKIRDIVKSGV